MNELKETILIENMIYEIRGKQVMLDSDLAKLYKCTNGTKDINKAVKRNIERFPNNFYFQITKEEFENLKFQIGTSSRNTYGGIRKLPYVFTEQGISMLSSVLKTTIATEISIQIMRTFVTMRKYISSNLLEQQYINNLVLEHDTHIKYLQQSFSKLEEKKKVNQIYFDGQIYDAYSKLLDIMIEAKQELIIIDRFADKIVLDMISRLKIPVILITKQNGLLKELDVIKYQQQYHNLQVIYNNTFHDRYLILDNHKIYHCGTSINQAGNRTFSINLLEDDIIKQTLIQNINKVAKNCN